ncbi:MAG TPA: hypothetical protein VK716_02815 [Terracidiphilus sp.]|nr:hypothetical protein [Terracidiphilus sp.]
MEIIRKRTIASLFAFSVLAFAVMGYHPGAEDDNFYLPAIKARLNPSLLQHGSQFFTLQLRTSKFDNWMAAFVQTTHIPLDWSELLWQFLSTFFILFACFAILSQLFKETAARWAGIALVAAMFTLPVSGTALYLVDQYLHPRNPATALILGAIALILAGRRLLSVPLLLIAFVLHPLMAAFGISFCCVLTVCMLAPVQVRLFEPRKRLVPQTATPVAALVPFGWILSQPSPIWLQALHTRSCFFLYQWEWYEWLGAIAPLIIFWVGARFARKQGNSKLSTFLMALAAYGFFQQILAMALLSPIAPASFATLEPMRYLHLIYVFLCLIGGAYLGKYLLKTSVWRWAVFLVIANGSMFFVQRQLFAATPHIELPGIAPANPWLQSFAWIRANTPVDAYFALDPKYMAAPGEDYHSFRALAERSVLADAYKDTATVTKQPELAQDWKTQVDAQANWPRFQFQDFDRLKSQFGVTWVLVSYPAPAGLDCRWHNATLAVCRIP